VAEFAPDQNGLRKEVVTDDATGHYQILTMGWLNGRRRVHGTLVHIDVRDDKVWVEHDGTNLEIIQDLLDAGIPAKDIVVVSTRRSTGTSPSSPPRKKRGGT
jgi:hypothetical protein